MANRSSAKLSKKKKSAINRLQLLLEILYTSKLRGRRVSGLPMHTLIVYCGYNSSFVIFTYAHRPSLFLSSSLSFLFSFFLSNFFSFFLSFFFLSFFLSFFFLSFSVFLSLFNSFFLRILPFFHLFNIYT